MKNNVDTIDLNTVNDENGCTPLRDLELFLIKKKKPTQHAVYYNEYVQRISKPALDKTQ
jgi:hypothetical protein